MSIPLRYGTTSMTPEEVLANKEAFKKCQFLLGTVQPSKDDSDYLEFQDVSIPLRYGTTAVFSCYY